MWGRFTPQPSRPGKKNVVLDLEGSTPSTNTWVSSLFAQTNSYVLYYSWIWKSLYDILRGLNSLFIEAFTYFMAYPLKGGADVENLKRPAALKTAMQCACVFLTSIGPTGERRSPTLPLIAIFWIAPLHFCDRSVPSQLKENSVLRAKAATTILKISSDLGPLSTYDFRPVFAKGRHNTSHYFFLSLSGCCAKMHRYVRPLLKCRLNFKSCERERSNALLGHQRRRNCIAFFCKFAKGKMVSADLGRVVEL